MDICKYVADIASIHSIHAQAWTTPSFQPRNVATFACKQNAVMKLSVFGKTLRNCRAPSFQNELNLNCILCDAQVQPVCRSRRRNRIGPLLLFQFLEWYHLLTCPCRCRNSTLNISKWQYCESNKRLRPFKPTSCATNYPTQPHRAGT